MKTRLIAVIGAAFLSVAHAKEPCTNALLNGAYDGVQGVRIEGSKTFIEKEALQRKGCCAAERRKLFS